MPTDKVLINTNCDSTPHTFSVAVYKNGVGRPQTIAGPFTDYSAAKLARDEEKIRLATTTTSGKKRNKQVFNTDEIPHLWAHKTQASARNQQGNLYFENETIYSCHSSPIAKHVTNSKGSPCILLKSEKYSVITGGHISAVRFAIPSSVTVFNVPEVDTRWQAIDHASNLKAYVEKVNDNIDKAVRARTNISYLLNIATNARNELKAYCKFFALKMPKVQMVPAADSDSIKACKAKLAKLAAIKAKKMRKENEVQRKLDAIAYMEKIKVWMINHPEYAARWNGTVENAESLARELKEIEQAQRDLKALTVWMGEHSEITTWDGSLEQGKTLKADWITADTLARNAAKIAAWLDGTGNSYGLPYEAPTMLRVKGSNVETSKGVSFPVSHARRGLALVKAVMQRGEEWKRNGHTCHLGHYQIDRIDANGTVHAGCHVVTYEAIARIESALLATATTDESEAN